MNKKILLLLIIFVTYGQLWASEATTKAFMDGLKKYEGNDKNSLFKNELQPIQINTTMQPSQTENGNWDFRNRIKNTSTRPKKTSRQVGNSTFLKEEKETKLVRLHILTLHQDTELIEFEFDFYALGINEKVGTESFINECNAGNIDCNNMIFKVNINILQNNDTKLQLFQQMFGAELPFQLLAEDGTDDITNLYSYISYEYIDDLNKQYCTLYKKMIGTLKTIDHNSELNTIIKEFFENSKKPSFFEQCRPYLWYTIPIALFGLYSLYKNYLSQ